jgi:hypothetical protein
MRARLGELKRDARDRMSLLVMVRSFLGCSGVGAALGGSWGLLGSLSDLCASWCCCCMTAVKEDV